MVNAACIPECETAEQTHDVTMAMLEMARDRLVVLKEVCEELLPAVDHTMPDPAEINTGKLGNTGAVTTDTCNTARKTMWLLLETKLEEARKLNVQNHMTMEANCWHHMQNMVVDGATTENVFSPENFTER